MPTPGCLDTREQEVTGLITAQMSWTSDAPAQCPPTSVHPETVSEAP